jgi:23S rRNA pseudouridine1911/1915/1917 synthase
VKLEFVVDVAGKTLAALVREKAPGMPWEKARRLCRDGKVQLDGTTVTDGAQRVSSGQHISVDDTRPRVEAPVQGQIVFEDSQVVVLDKPAGVSSVPYEKKESGTALDLIRAHWRHQGRKATEQPLFVVHRIDKETSGLLLFAKTKAAEKALAWQFRRHTVGRKYLCVAHGEVHDQRIESLLVEDRGDGLRGSSRGRGSGSGRGKTGKRAVTHVRRLQKGRGATLCEVQLETGKTHQIRIHLAEIGHPLVGEKVYIRDYSGELVAAPRLLLHAQTLEFEHPQSGVRVALQSPIPADFAVAWAGLETH